MKHEKHRDHFVYVIKGPFIYGQQSQIIHAGKLMCENCGIMLQWVTKDAIDAHNTNTQKMTLSQFYKKWNDYEHSTDKNDPAIIWLSVSYSEKDIAKKNGASWDPYHKAWYTTTRRKDADKLTRFMDEQDIIKLGINK